MAIVICTFPERKHWNVSVNRNLMCDSDFYAYSWRHILIIYSILPLRNLLLKVIRHVMKNRDETSHLWLPHDQTCEQSMAVEGESGAVETDVPAENDNHFKETLKQSQSSSAPGENRGHTERVAKTSTIDSYSTVITITRQSSRNPLKSTKEESDDDDETLASLAAAKRKTLQMQHVSTTNTTRKGTSE